MKDRPMKVFSGTVNRALGERVARELLITLGDVAIDRFPDGEVTVRYNENLRDDDIFLLITLASKIDPSCFMEMLQLIDAARRASAGRIVVVLSYYGYARQDRKDRSRTPISAKVVARCIEEMGAHHVMVLDLHSQQIQGFFEIPADTLYGRPELVQVVRNQIRQRVGMTPEAFARNVVVVAPDIGAAPMVDSYADRLGCDIAILHKKRISGQRVKLLTLIGEVKGKIAIMVDDMVSTAGTLAKGADMLKARGAERVFAVAVHPVLVGSAQSLIEHSPIELLYVTDSIPLPRRLRTQKIQQVSIANLLARAIRATHSGESVSSLLA